MSDGAGRRVYGADPGDPAAGPELGHVYVELMGGPLDGQLLDVTGWTSEERAVGALLIAPRGAYGPGGRADYAPAPGDADHRFHWEGDTP
ncbi:hypothetical protein ACIBEA_41835 [Streptomyces sp. NPDC051555]|uniref:hypothetical protein n=1 Tax=Streptomyces sp. NPDC051555 TaxID=3365657 RepID=UPI00379066E5